MIVKTETNSYHVRWEPRYHKVNYVVCIISNDKETVSEGRARGTEKAFKRAISKFPQKLKDIFWKTYFER